MTFVLSIDLMDCIDSFTAKINVKPFGSKERVDGVGKFNNPAGNPHAFRKFAFRSAPAVSLFSLLIQDSTGR
jgi:hypothetical protein